MQFHRHWVRVVVEPPVGSTLDPVVAYGCSNQSIEAARRDADARGRRILDGLELGEPPDPYGYPDERPMREELIETRERDGHLVAAISRNGSGCLVLNTSEFMFIDVDRGIDTPIAALRRGLSRLFGGADTDAQEEAVLGRFRTVAGEEGLVLRVYRTAGGWRAAVLNRVFDPGDESSDALLRRFGADPLYRRLCRGQRCYRARLTPKPWRCAAPAPPSGFPWASDEAEATFREWEIDYHERCREWAVCRPLLTVGDEPPDARVASVLELHDEMTCVEGMLA